MLHKFEEHINLNFPFLKNSKILIGISGGIDSVVLTHLFYKLNYNITLAHCNFMLRDNDSKLDEDFVIKLGEKLNLETITTSFNTREFSKENKLSIQLSARKLRYDWFKKLCKKGCKYVTTGHHKDDNLETFIINLSRGTGIDGLTGIPKQNGNIIRPLLVFSREEIKNFAKKNNITWREDSTNSETKYLRNKIRHEIVPKLKEINNNFLDNFSKTIENLEETKKIKNDRIENITKKIIHKENDITFFNISEILKLSNPKAYLYEFLNDYGFTQWKDILSLLTAQSGKKIETKTHILLKDRGFLLFSQKAVTNELISFFINEGFFELKKPIHLKFEKCESEAINSTKSIFFDKKSVTFPLIIRKWRVGDTFYPTKMNGKKKLSKYFKDEKLSQFHKEKIWLLCDNNDKIIWVIGMRQDRRFLPKSNLNTIKISIL